MAKDPTLAKYQDLVKKLIGEFDSVQIENVPRSDNAQADSLAKSKEPSKVLKQPSIKLMCIATSGEGWRDPIRKYLATSKLPKDPKEAAKVRKCSGRYFLIGEEL